MYVKRMICMFLSCVFLIGTMQLTANAAMIDDAKAEDYADCSITPFATGSFNLSIPANTKVRANSSFPLAAGETITIKASYSPFSASVDIGVIAPDGNFYFFTITGGSIDETIQVSESGDYTLQIRNNSSSEIQVAGFVNY